MTIETATNDSERFEGTSGSDLVRYPRTVTERPSTAVVFAIAAETGRDPLDLPSLGDVIDTEALDRLFTHSSGTSPREVTVSLRYEGYEVRIDRRSIELSSVE